MSLICKNCGGKIAFDSEKQKIFCEFCGCEQPITNSLDITIFEETENIKNVLEIYQKASDLMNLHTLNSLTAAEAMFKRIPDIFDAANLAAKCKNEIVALKTEADYQSALKGMSSENLTELRLAHSIFFSLGDYKESASKLRDCNALIASLEKSEQLRKDADEYKQKQLRLKRKRRLKLSLLLITLIIITFFAVRSKIYSSSNIKITVSPNEDNYITEAYGSYKFKYDIKIKNKGFLDVSSIEGNVIFEDENGEILIDSNFNFYNHSSAVVRAKSHRSYTWEITVGSYDTALLLYESDFDEIDIKIDITKITYTNGKTKNYK